MSATAAIVGGAVAAGSAIAGGISSGIGSKKKQKRQFNYNNLLMDKQFEQNKALMQEQQDFQLRSWEMENAYNTPEAQRKRYEQAGLNPALMYQQGDTGNAGSVGGYDSLPVDYSSFKNEVPDNAAQTAAAALNSAGSIMKVLSGIEDINIKQKTADEIESRKHLNDVQADYKNWELGNAPERWRLDELLGMQNYALRGGDYKTADVESLKAMRMQLLRSELRGLDDDHFMSLLNRSLARANIRLTKEQLSTLVHKLQWSKDEYDMWKQTEKPFSSLGVFKRPLESIGGNLSNALGEALGAWLSGSRGLRKSLSKSARRYMSGSETHKSIGGGQWTDYEYKHD